MSNGNVCSIVISVYNEQESLNALYNELVATHSSTDNNLEVLKTIAEVDTMVKDNSHDGCNKFRGEQITTISRLFQKLL